MREKKKRHAPRLTSPWLFLSITFTGCRYCCCLLLTLLLLPYRVDQYGLDRKKNYGADAVRSSGQLVYIYTRTAINRRLSPSRVRGAICNRDASTSERRGDFGV